MTKFLWELVQILNKIYMCLPEQNPETELLAWHHKVVKWHLPTRPPPLPPPPKQMVSCAVQTDITWVKSENPVRPKTPLPKGTQTETQTSTPQQTPTKASQARPGRSSANKNAAEIVDRVAIQKKTTAPVRSTSVSSWGKKIACQGSSQGTRQTEKNGARSCEGL